jgi:hypothetical protein
MENNNDAGHVTKLEIPLIDKKLGNVKISEKIIKKLSTIIKIPSWHLKFYLMRSLLY